MDKHQINPVKKEDSIPLLEPEKHNIIIGNLTKVMRQKDGSKILDLATKIRENQREDVQSISTESADDLTVARSRESHADIVAFIKEKYSDPLAKENSFFVKTIAWTNEKVREYNQYIRGIYLSAHYPEHQKPYQKILVGDKLLADSPIIEKVQGPIGWVDKIVLTTNQEFEVVELETTLGSFETPNEMVGIKHYKANVKFYDVEKEKFETQWIKIVHEDAQWAFDAALGGIRGNALTCHHSKKGYWWKKYFKFKRLFAEVSHAYALTAHSAQGSTYYNTIVDANNIILNQRVRERNRILYTAITRAKDHLLIIN